VFRCLCWLQYSSFVGSTMALKSRSWYSLLLSVMQHEYLMFTNNFRLKFSIPPPQFFLNGTDPISDARGNDSQFIFFRGLNQWEQKGELNPPRESMTPHYAEGLIHTTMTILHFFSSVAHVWVPGAKTTGPIAKKLCFNSIFSAVRNFKFRHMFCRNKMFCSVKSHFPVHLP
jgi:hypothetical protein